MRFRNSEYLFEICCLLEYHTFIEINTYLNFRSISSVSRKISAIVSGNEVKMM